MGDTVARPLVSVIIPTYNRKRMLQEVLDSLALQTLPLDLFEVIVVDDGGQDGSGEIVDQVFPFRLRYIRQENQGDAVARNTGCDASDADILVSLDDDMVLEKEFLARLIAKLSQARKKIVAGTWLLWLEDTNPLTVPARFERVPVIDESFEIPFTQVNTHSLAMYREDFIAIGRMQDLGFSGSSMWTDVDLAYRAYLEGYQFIKVGDAIIWHRDNVFRSLESQIRRIQEAAFRSIILFQKHPDLIRYLPMFDDKTPINLDRDTPRLVLRKLLRRFNSTGPALRVLERIHQFIRYRVRFYRLLITVERWIIGGYIAKGYRRGLKELSV